MPDDGEPVDVSDWDWDAIRAEERNARAKGDRLPRCWVCGNPMWCGQRDRHHTCTPSVPVDPGQVRLT